MRAKGSKMRDEERARGLERSCCASEMRTKARVEKRGGEKVEGSSNSVAELRMCNSWSQVNMNGISFDEGNLVFPTRTEDLLHLHANLPLQHKDTVTSYTSFKMRSTAPLVW